jgi:hypothetical protein
MRNNNDDDAPFGVRRVPQIAIPRAVPAGAGAGGAIFGGGAGAGAGFVGIPNGAGTGGFGGAQAGGGAGAGFGGAQAGGGAGAGFGGAQAGGGAGAGFGGAPAGGGAGAGAGFGGAIFGGGAGAGAGANNDRPVTPTNQIFQLNPDARGRIDTPPPPNLIATPQVPVVQNQVVVPPQVVVQPQPIGGQTHFFNGIDTPPPSPRGN